MDELFAEIDKSIDAGTIVFEERQAAEGAEWLERIEEENAGELTPERLAARGQGGTAEAMNTGTELPARRAARSVSRSSRASAWTRRSRPPPAGASPAPEARWASPLAPQSGQRRPP